jgi:lysosomal acid lipase/cholesteryl ester hydrolase
MFDYGWTKNMLKYGSITPPDYNLGSITAPVFLHYSDNDWMAAVTDVDELASKLGNLIGKFRVSDPKFNHLDYTYGTDVKTLLYDRVISFIKRY